MACSFRLTALVHLLIGAHGQIRVMAPNWLVTKLSTTSGRIDGSTATFGAPFYGERILGQLMYEDPKKEAHCTAEDYNIRDPETMPVVHSEETYNEVKLINIVMVRRGLCSFVTKVKIARQKGAHAVIIVDKADSTLTPKDIKRIIVADDGYGAGVDIPSILVSKEEGEQLISAVKASKVIIELAWDIPTAKAVIMDLWMSSGSKESMKFLQEFSPKRKALNEYIRFHPHYYIFAMQSGQDFNSLCTDQSAQYCAEDPDVSGPITGKMVIDEDVRQLCIHEKTKIARTDLDAVRTNKPPVEYAEKYWDYVEKLAEACPMETTSTRPDDRFGTECSEKLMSKLRIDVSEINHCIIDNKEKFLRQQREETAWSPHALRINGWRYSGTMDADLVTRALCSGFIEQPSECKRLVEPTNPFKAFHPHQAVATDGVSIGTLISALFVVAILAVGALFFYKKSLTKSIHTALREEVMLEVQTQMESYKQLPA